jgi:hypothetical protein
MLSRATPATIGGAAYVNWGAACINWGAISVNTMRPTMKSEVVGV